VRASPQHQVCLMAGDTVARSVNKFTYIRVGGQIRWIYPPLNKPKTLAVIGPGQLSHQAGDALLTEISNGDRRKSYGHFGL
jgi:hypothetical protein